MRSTSAEEALWRRLRNRGSGGLKFRRQHPIDRYIVDFYCAAARLVVEVDGPSHRGREEYDSNRTEHLESRGYGVIRYTNKEVLEETEEVIERIVKVALSRVKERAVRARLEPGEGRALLTDRDKAPTQEKSMNDVNTSSKPSDLKITDMRIARLVDCPMRSNLIRLDTNQGIYGLGEVRDGASAIYALLLKRQLLGENPCDVDRLFRKIKQFGGHARQGGGVCAVEMALMDLAGKAYGVPAYQLAGGKFRDRIRIYCDTSSSSDADEMGKRLRARMEMGFTFLKMDIGLRLLKDVEGAISAPAGMLETNQVMHPFTGIQITDKGIDWLCDYVATVRDMVGYDIPLASDHFGHMGIESCIRLGKRLDRFNLAWLEDLVPWQFTDQYVKISQACDTPICTGEDIYLKEGFRDLFENRAIAVCHPDLATSGGILETKKIGDLAQEHGIAMALHMAATPVAQMASVHCAAATENFLVLENHAVDHPDWNDLVTGLPNPIIQDGYIAVPESPGLGVDLNEEAIRAHLHPDYPGYFEPTPEWDSEQVNDRLWS